MDEEKKIPAFTEAEEMEIYEKVIAIGGKTTAVLMLLEGAESVQKAAKAYRVHTVIKDESATEDFEKLMRLAVGQMQVICNIAELAFGDTAEQECGFMMSLKQAVDLFEKLQKEEKQ